MEAPILNPIGIPLRIKSIRAICRSKWNARRFWREPGNPADRIGMNFRLLYASSNRSRRAFAMSAIEQANSDHSKIIISKYEATSNTLAPARAEILGTKLNHDDRSNDRKPPFLPAARVRFDVSCSASTTENREMSATSFQVQNLEGSIEGPNRSDPDGMRFFSMPGIRSLNNPGHPI